LAGERLEYRGYSACTALIEIGHGFRPIVLDGGQRTVRETIADEQDRVGECRRVGRKNGAERGCDSQCTTETPAIDPEALHCVITDVLKARERGDWMVAARTLLDV
jgi:hypothetical protein